MYDELVKRVRQVAEEVCDDYDVDPYIAEQRYFVIEEAADAIKALSKLALDEHNRAAVAAWERRWIPVAEQLPETPGEYMVAYHPCYWDSVHDEIKVGLDSFRGKTSWARKKYQRVTHWMPLPEPPKEGLV